MLGNFLLNKAPIADLCNIIKAKSTSRKFPRLSYFNTLKVAVKLEEPPLSTVDVPMEISSKSREHTNQVQGILNIGCKGESFIE